MIMSDESILVNNNSKDNKNLKIIYQEKVYEKNIINDIELSRLKFLEELFNSPELNISKMDLIESNMNFLTSNIKPKIDLISSKFFLYNNNFTHFTGDKISINQAHKIKNYHDLNINLNKESEIAILKLKFLSFFESIPMIRKKLNNLYYKNDNKLIRDYTYIYFPIAKLINDLYQTKTENRPLVIGVQAHQGCGKTTMTSIISLILKGFYDVNCLNISIDDFYKTFDELNKLKQEKPDFKYRGPPGTHDLKLAKNLFDKIKNNEIGYYIPIYNKSFNNGKGERIDNGFEIRFPVEVLIFEGWFLGAKSKDVAKMINNKNNKYKNIREINQVNRENNTKEYSEISDNQEERNMDSLLLQSNKNLKDYEDIWKDIDVFISIKPENFYLSKKWRIQAEKNLKSGMDYKTIRDFIEYFWRSVPPEIYLDKLEELDRPLIRLLIDKNREFYI